MICSASIVVGPLAASTINFALNLWALSLLIDFYKAAGMKKSLNYWYILRWLINCVLFLEILASWVISYSFIFNFVSIQLFGVNSVFIVNAAVKLGNTYKFCTLFHKEFGSPITDITEALYDEFLSFYTNFNSKILCNFFII